MPASQLTQKHAKDFAAAIAKGHTIAIAAHSIGVNKSTVMRWQQRGRDAIAISEETGKPIPKADQLFASVATECASARASLQQRLEQRLSDLVPDMDARDALSVLERLASGEWGKTERVEHSHSEKVKPTADQIADLERAFAKTALRGGDVK